MIYYLESLKTELQDVKSDIVEYEGKDAYYGLMRYLHSIVAITASNIVISAGAVWLPFIVAGYFNDSVQEAVLSRLNFLLVLADIQAQRLQDRGQDGTGRNEKKMNANKYYHNFFIFICGTKGVRKIILLSDFSWPLPQNDQDKSFQCSISLPKGIWMSLNTFLTLFRYFTHF